MKNCLENLDGRAHAVRIKRESYFSSQDDSLTSQIHENNLDALNRNNPEVLVMGTILLTLIFSTALVNGLYPSKTIIASEISDVRAWFTILTAVG